MKQYEFIELIPLCAPFQLEMDFPFTDECTEDEHAELSAKMVAVLNQEEVTGITIALTASAQVNEQQIFGLLLLLELTQVRNIQFVVNDAHWYSNQQAIAKAKSRLLRRHVEIKIADEQQGLRLNRPNYSNWRIHCRKSLLLLADKVLDQVEQNAKQTSLTIPCKVQFPMRNDEKKKKYDACSYYLYLIIGLLKCNPNAVSLFWHRDQNVGGNDLEQLFLMLIKLNIPHINLTFGGGAKPVGMGGAIKQLQTAVSNYSKTENVKVKLYNNISRFFNSSRSVDARNAKNRIKEKLARRAARSMMFQSAVDPGDEVGVAAPSLLKNGTQ